MIGTLAFAGMLLSISVSASAEHTCGSRTGANEPASKTYPLSRRDGKPSRAVKVGCTNENDVIKITLVSTASKKTLQHFYQAQTIEYLAAYTPDLDGDGNGDLVITMNWGSPNMDIKGWRYNKSRDRLEEIFELSGTNFIKSRDGWIVTVGKGGADLWGYTFLKWNGQKFIPHYEIEEHVGDEVQCLYYEISSDFQYKDVKDIAILNWLMAYCGVGSAGLGEFGESILSPAK
ncbi:MAG: hypothetical protein HGA47_00360 [Zoogloea sp.]|nr:hypothetical protein [Zoogloea sp.]